MHVGRRISQALSFSILRLNSNKIGTVACVPRFLKLFSCVFESRELAELREEQVSVSMRELITGPRMAEIAFAHQTVEYAAWKAIP